MAYDFSALFFVPVLCSLLVLLLLVIVVLLIWCPLSPNSPAALTGTYDALNQQENVNAARSLLIIVLSPPSNPHYKQFHHIVNANNEAPPFNYPNPFMYPKQVSTQLLLFVCCVRLL